MNLIFFQYGDYEDAYLRFSTGGEETYRDQRRSVEFVASLSESFTVTVVAVSGRPHNSKLGDRLHSVGISQTTANSRRKVNELLSSLNPNLIICRTPNHSVLRWANRYEVPCLPCFADTFETGIRSLPRRVLLGRLLKEKVFPCVANHSLNASLSLSSSLGCPVEKIVPWDYTRLDVRADREQRHIGDRFKLLYAGALSKEKGLVDCFHAISDLQKCSTHDYRFNVAGGGDMQSWQLLAEDLGIAESVTFHGLLPHTRVRELMHESDAVIVPSRHEYAEGLPNTIYEALASRAPLIISNHRAFHKRLVPDEECLVFQAGSPSSLASEIKRLSMNQGLSERLSENSREAHQKLYCGTEWTELIQRFLNDPSNRTKWVSELNLTHWRH